VIRPADANESAAAWKLALELPGPSALVFCRQNVPVFDDVDIIRAGVPQGAYVLIDPPGTPDVLLMGTGSEVSLAVEAAARLAEEGIQARVVSMPSWEVFEAQPPAYRESVLPASVRARVAVEAASPMGWERYTGPLGGFVGIDHFGASAPGAVVYEKFGITTEAVIEQARHSIQRVRER
jgi:transketolase